MCQDEILALGALSRAILPDVGVGPRPRDPNTGMAVALLHPSLGGYVLNEHYSAAIRHQNKAINLCLKRMHDGPDCMSAHARLINTPLLLANELLQSNIKGAEGLMTTGIRLLRDRVPRNGASVRRVRGES